MASAPSTPKAGWEVKTLGELTEVVTKGTTPTSVGYKFTERGIAFVKVESINSEGHFLESKIARINEDCHNTLKRSQLKAGDILFSIAGALGRTAIVSKEILPANTNQALAIIRLKPSADVSLRFIEKALSTGFVLDQVEKLKGGVAQLNLSLSQVKSFRIPIPPLAEQERIVGILDEAFEGIAAATAQAEKNLHNARELFQSVLQSTFSQKGDDWEETTLGEVCGFVRGPFGGSLKKSCFKPEGFAVYEQQHAINNQFNSIRYFVDEVKFDEMKRFELIPGDLIMSCSGTMGKVALVPEGIKPGIINQALLKLTPQSGLNEHFLKSWMGSPNFQQEIDNLAEGAAIKNVASVKILKEINIPLPPLPTQQAIVEKLDALSEETKALEAIYERKQSALAELKQSLLQKAFAGEL